MKVSTRNRSWFFFYLQPLFLSALCPSYGGRSRDQLLHLAGKVGGGREGKEEGALALLKLLFTCGMKVTEFFRDARLL